MVIKEDDDANLQYGEQAAVDTAVVGPEKAKRRSTLLTLATKFKSNGQSERGTSDPFEQLFFAEKVTTASSKWH